MSPSFRKNLLGGLLFSSHFWHHKVRIGAAPIMGHRRINASHFNGLGIPPRLRERFSIEFLFSCGNFFENGHAYRMKFASSVCQVIFWCSTRHVEPNHDQQWRHTGQRQEARQLLAGIYSWFAEGFETADIQEAGALLEELA